LILDFNDQINDQINNSSFSIKITENAKIAKIINDHQTRTSVTSQKVNRSKSLELESSESNNLSDFDASDASSEHFKQIITEFVDYKTLNNFWVRNHNWNFVNKANRVQIELNTSQTVKQAKASSDWKQWKLAFRSELDAHIKNDIFILKIFLLNQWILLTCWVTIIKREFKKKMIKYKVKWVCKKFCQKQRINYDEIFALMIRVIIIKMLLALMIKYDYEVKQMNIIITFLEAHLKEKIWVQQSSRFK